VAKRAGHTTATISEILGVSKSTISRALNDDPRISEETRREIKSLAIELGYTPNAIARDLALNKRSIVGFVLSESSNYFYQEHVQDFVKKVAMRGMQTMMFQVSAEETIEAILPDMLRYRLAGCVVIPQVNVTETAMEVCRRSGISVVLLNRILRNSPANSVLSNHAAGSYRLTRLLLDAGHRKITFVAGTPTPTFRDREAGFLEALADAGLQPFARLEGQFDFRQTYDVVADHIRSGAAPDAIAAANDLMAFATIDAVEQSGLQVPKDVSVVGFDNSRIGEWPSYNLTTIAQPVAQMYDRSLDLICGQLETATSPEHVYIDGTLIVRGSARMPAEVVQPQGVV
jgi:LacI family transcriptional regulator